MIVNLSKSPATPGHSIGDERKSMTVANLGKFAPEAHSDGVYEAFCEFLEQFSYEYDAVSKEPPKYSDKD